MRLLLIGLGTSVGIPAIAAVWATVWKVLAHPGRPTVMDFAIGIELIVAAVVFELSELGYSLANEAPGKFIGYEVGIVFALLAFVLPAFACWMRFGYQAAGGQWVQSASLVAWSSALGCAILGGTFAADYFSGYILG